MTHITVEYSSLIRSPSHKWDIIDASTGVCASLYLCSLFVSRIYEQRLGPILPLFFSHPTRHAKFSRYLELLPVGKFSLLYLQHLKKIGSYAGTYRRTIHKVQVWPAHPATYRLKKEPAKNYFLRLIKTLACSFFKNQKTTSQSFSHPQK